MKKSIFILVFMAALVSCVNEPHGNFDYAVFNRERQLWLGQDIQNYIFYSSEGRGMSGGPLSGHLYVQDGVIAYIQFSRNPPVPAEEVVFPQFFFGNTISDVYAKIETVASDASWCDTVEIRYDSEWHYPKYFRCDWASGGFLFVKIDEFSIGTERP